MAARFVATGTLRFDAFGTVGPHGYAVRNPDAQASTAVMLARTLVVPAGTDPLATRGSVMARPVPSGEFTGSACAGTGVQHSRRRGE